jgi:predicted HicB family RNase H-like nuclease
MTETNSTEHHREIIEAAYGLYCGHADWATFFRQILGQKGLVRKTFPTHESFAKFKRTDTYSEIQHMLRRLREHGPVPPEGKEPTRVITVRLPKSVHESLRDEAYEYRTSMNKLCISKLLQFIAEEVVPAKR